MSDGQTHWEGCWKEHRHHDCAIAEIDRLNAEVEKYQSALVQIIAENENGDAGHSSNSELVMRNIADQCLYGVAHYDKHYEDTVSIRRKK